MSRPVRIGIAGFGTAGRSFVPAIQAHEGYELVAVAEPAQVLRDEIARELDIDVYASLTEMLAHPELDAIYIALEFVEIERVHRPTTFECKVIGDIY